MADVQGPADLAPQLVNVHRAAVDHVVGERAQRLQRLPLQRDRIGQGIFMKYLTVDDDSAAGIRTGGIGSTGK